MTNAISDQARNPLEVARPLTGGDLLHLDGQLFLGEEGLLAVALAPGSIPALQQEPEPTHWLLPLEVPEFARLAAEVSGEVFWIATRPPREVIGALGDDVRGVWLDGRTVVLNLGGPVRRLHMAYAPHASFLTTYLARLATDHWSGAPVSALSQSNLLQYFSIAA